MPRVSVLGKPGAIQICSSSEYEGGGTRSLAKRAREPELLLSVTSHASLVTLREAAEFQNLATEAPEALIIDCGDRSVTPCSSLHLCCLCGGRSASDSPNHTVRSDLLGPASGHPLPPACCLGTSFSSLSPPAITDCMPFSAARVESQADF